MGFKDRFGVDLGVFKEKTTWKAFVIGLVMFSVIGYSGLSVFDLASDSYGVDRSSARIAPDFEIETINRTGFEDNYTNETGWFKLSEHRGKVVIIDFMAIDCANCHLVQEHLDLRIDEWRGLNELHEVVIVSIGCWYATETLSELNETFGDSSKDSHMPWIVGTGATDSIILNDSRGDMVEYYQAQGIPVAYLWIMKDLF